MRISDKMISQNLFSNVNRVREQMVELQTDLATTKKLRTPSDDPIGYFQVTSFKNQIARNEQYLQNIGRITTRLDETSALLDSAVDFLSEAKSIATQGASETTDAESRSALAAQIEQIMQSVKEIGNAKHNGKFLFGGTDTVGEPPFQESGGGIVYTGNDGKIQNQIGEGLGVIINKTGEEVFQPDGGVDLFDTLQRLKEGLEQNDTAAIQSTIDELGTGTEQLLSVSSEIGALQNRLTLTEDLLTQRNLDMSEFVSSIEDTDVVEASIEFQQTQNAYQFGLRSFSDLVQTNLLNFLG